MCQQRGHNCRHSQATNRTNVHTSEGGQEGGTAGGFPGSPVSLQFLPAGLCLAMSAAAGVTVVTSSCPCREASVRGGLLPAHPTSERGLHPPLQSVPCWSTGPSPTPATATGLGQGHQQLELRWSPRSPPGPDKTQQPDSWTSGSSKPGPVGACFRGSATRCWCWGGGSLTPQSA